MGAIFIYETGHKPVNAKQEIVYLRMCGLHETSIVNDTGQSKYHTKL